MAQNSPELLLLKFLPLTYHQSHFLAITLDFMSVFTIAFLRAAHFFYSLACIPQSWPMASFEAFLIYFFSLQQEEEKMKQMLNTLNISDFISKCTNYNIIIHIYYRTLHGGFFVTEHSTR